MVEARPHYFVIPRCRWAKIAVRATAATTRRERSLGVDLLCADSMRVGYTLTHDEIWRCKQGSREDTKAERTHRFREALHMKERDRGYK